jgi:hypothetical protein
MLDPISIDALEAEVANENFLDPRLTARLEKLVRAVSKNPAAAFPKLLGDAELEAAYRFFANVRVTPKDILRPHQEATRARCVGRDVVRVLHDTTEFAYRRDGKRRGFDEDRSYQSFSAHVSLAVSADPQRRPEGVAAIRTWPQGDKSCGEQGLWFEQILESERNLEGCGLVHICDRGSDDFVLLHQLVSTGRRFVLRNRADRLTKNGVDGANEKMRSVLARIEHKEERLAWINPRRKESSEHRAKIHPEREARSIHLNIAAARLDLVRPKTIRKASTREAPESVSVNVVRVWEPSPPEGETPIEWILYTSEPIETAADVEAVVDHYRARWLIEEYFKALKSGCSFEQRQLRDYDSLVNALAFFAPLAWNILQLRTVARFEPDAPARRVVTNDQLDVLRSLGRRKLPDAPTARDVLLAIAALGGHIKYAPDPGWLTIARGWETLEKLTAGWIAAKLQFHRDQR